MKEKIIIFIGGLLVGAIISTGILYGLSLTNNDTCDCVPTNIQDRQHGGRPDFKNGDMGNPPEKPDGEPPQEGGNNA